MPHLDALVVVSMVMFFNSLSIIFIIDYIGMLSVNSMDINEFYFIVFGVLIVIINHIIFIRNKRYLNLVNIYSDEPVILKKKRVVFIWLYILLSIILPFILSEIIRNS
jgi:hypothetical protein